MAVLLTALVSCKREEKDEMNNPLINMINEDIHNKVDSQFLNDVTVAGLKILNVTQYAKEKELLKKQETLFQKLKLNMYI